MELNNLIDIKENQLLKLDKKLLEILLKDKTTGKNILWATDNYLSHGSFYAPEREIHIEQITSRNGNIIKPRIEKSKTEQTLFETLTISTECEGCKKGNSQKHNGIYCKIKDWKTGKTVRFVDLTEGK